MFLCRPSTISSLSAIGSNAGIDLERSKDYSGEPPSNWTSHSHGIQLYERGAKIRGVTPQTLA